MDHDYTNLLWEESGDITVLLDDLADADFDQPSLCEGWRVRDVVSHMILGHTTPMPKMLMSIARFRFNVPRASRALSAHYGSAHTADELRATWTEMVADRTVKGIGRVIPDHEGFTDHLVHHQDIRRSLDRPRSIPAERLVAALDALPKIGGFLKSKQRMKGLTWAATDVDWTWGEGPEVRGGAESLILAASGRDASLDDLAGDGVGMLQTRLSAG